MILQQMNDSGDNVIQKNNFVEPSEGSSLQ